MSWNFLESVTPCNQTRSSRSLEAKLQALAIGLASKSSVEIKNRRMMMVIGENHKIFLLHIICSDLSFYCTRAQNKYLPGKFVDVPVAVDFFTCPDSRNWPFLGE